MKINTLVLISTIFFITGTLLGYNIKSEKEQNRREDPISFDNIKYLIKYQIPHTETKKTIFMTENNSVENIYISDQEIGTDKKIYTFDQNSLYGFHPPFYTYKEYVIVPISRKEDHHDLDLLIFDIDGTLITSSIIEKNPSLQNRIVSFKGEIVDGNNYIVKINAAIDEETKEQKYLDLSTGEVIEEYQETVSSHE